ncbi:hypothetical protein [Pseudomonas sp. GL93]|uniref:hypothetical protein n=1 Tax=Pseudomonas sp. GL93 TaxID=2014741 RepID=UPI0010585F0F|nr:hypothetical protein [Pseudomonas sp. GL93]
MPQEIVLAAKNPPLNTPHINCGSWLACDGDYGHDHSSYVLFPSPKKNIPRPSKIPTPSKALQTLALAENHVILALPSDHPPQHKPEFFPIMRG